MIVEVRFWCGRVFVLVYIHVSVVITIYLY